MSRRVYRIPTENNSAYQMLDADEYHKEFPMPEYSSTPLEPPVGYVRQDPLHVKLRQMLMQHVNRDDDNYIETMEEADDFDVGDADEHTPIAEAELAYQASQLQPAAPAPAPAPAPAAPPPAGPAAPAPAPAPGAEPA